MACAHPQARRPGCRDKPAIGRRRHPVPLPSMPIQCARAAGRMTPCASHAATRIRTTRPAAGDAASPRRSTVRSQRGHAAHPPSHSGRHRRPAGQGPAEARPPPAVPRGRGRHGRQHRHPNHQPVHGLEGHVARSRHHVLPLPCALLGPHVGLRPDGGARSRTALGLRHRGDVGGLPGAGRRLGNRPGPATEQRAGDLDRRGRRAALRRDRVGAGCQPLPPHGVRRPEQHAQPRPRAGCGRSVGSSCSRRWSCSRSSAPASRPTCPPGCSMPSACSGTVPPCCWLPPHWC